MNQNAYKTPSRIVLISTLMLVGCPSPAEQAALNGLAAFRACDLRTASAEFDEAYSLDNRPDFALAYALSDLAVLLEDPNLQPLARRLGFTADLRTEFLWGRGGVLDQLASPTATCDSIEEYLRANIPHPSAAESGPDVVDTINPGVTIEELRTNLVAISPRLLRIAQALELAAQNAGGNFNLEGGCGVGSLSVQAPELLAAAAAIEALRGAIMALEAYQWNIGLRRMVDSEGVEAELVAELNSQLLHQTPAAAAALETMRGHFLSRVIPLVRSATSAARAITTRPASSLIDWSRLPSSVLSDVETMASSLETALTMTTAQPIPFVEPALSIDARSFLTNIVDFGQLFPSGVFEVRDQPGCQPTENYNCRELSLVEAWIPTIEGALRPRFTPDPFADNFQSDFTLDNRWDTIADEVWEATFNPSDRWDELYGCSASNPAPIPDP